MTENEIATAIVDAALKVHRVAPKNEASGSEREGFRPTTRTDGSLAAIPRLSGFFERRLGARVTAEPVSPNATGPLTSASSSARNRPGPLFPICSAIHGTES